MTTVEIIAIGNEILIGDVLDTNTHWLCQQITGLGGHVVRATLVRDEVPVIAEVLRQAVARSTDVVFTTGGLGPTADDMTLQAVAQAAGVPLEEHAEALRLVQEKYKELAAQGYVAQADLTPERRKMAVLPRGAQALHNPAGAAPGVLLNIAETMVIVLPGVPTEMKGIFTTSLQPVLQAMFGESVFVERVVLVECGDESVLAPLVNRVAAAHPEVYVKSRAKAYGPNVRLKVTFSLAGRERAKVEEAVERAVADLRVALDEARIAIVSVDA
ncbi:MAG: molybdopterin-binding protein [Anaerolineae bacterium]|jgi:molybdenum cofactor synthesis domain-containing protein|nr:molybdopterin-binding protein [Anaerolineae bacterium]MDH7475173.1 molybdopterin-binding protein [Anaerolineae bacterium]